MWANSSPYDPEQEFRLPKAYDKVAECVLKVEYLGDLHDHFIEKAIQGSI